MVRIGFVLAAALFGACAAATPDSPDSVVASFYDRFINLSKKYYGRPSHERVSDLLTSDLLALLNAQLRYERYCKRIAPPGIKPHMIDQDPFFLAPDYIKKFSAEKSAIDGSSATVVVHLGDGYANWEDTVRLRRENGHWRVADIHWGGGGSLSNRLTSFMQQRCDT